MAQRLDYRSLIFIYEFKKDIGLSEIKDKLHRLSKEHNIDLKFGVLVTTKNITVASKKAKDFTDFLIVDSKEETLQGLRNLLEKRKPSLVYNIEFQKKDFIHHRNSGLNQVYCNFLKENNIILGLNFNLLNHSKNREFIIPRISQNIRFSKKYGFDIKIASFATDPFDMRSPKELESLFISLGMDAKAAKKAME